jgi:photosystem II stability/assembly factor-like uncharacterized protein
MTLPDPALVWRKTNAPVSSSRTDDIWFATPDIGWAVNSNGQILRTDDGGKSWNEQHKDDSVYLRCIGFAGTNTKVGWVGSISPARRLFVTRDGATWNTVDNLPPKPSKICGISVVDDQVIYASGTNVDIHFQTRERGWVVGGRDVIACPGRRATRDVVRPVVLFTTDGGNSWTDLIPQSAKKRFPHGEWGWKIFFLNDRVAFVSLENFLDGAILKSVDGGMTWERVRINDRQRNADLEGVGFVSEDKGWVGGWGDIDFSGGFTSKTEDGGKTWDNANEVGFRLNRFRFFGNPVTVGYASGDTVYKYSTEPGLEVAMASPVLLRGGQRAIAPGEGPVIAVPQGADTLRVEVWDRFGNRLEVMKEQKPEVGERTIQLDPQAVAAAGLLGSSGILRVTIDERVESRLVPLG